MDLNNRKTRSHFKLWLTFKQYAHIVLLNIWIYFLVKKFSNGLDLNGLQVGYWIYFFFSIMDMLLFLICDKEKVLFSLSHTSLCTTSQLLVCIKGLVINTILCRSLDTSLNKTEWINESMSMIVYKDIQLYFSKGKYILYFFQGGRYIFLYLYLSEFTNIKIKLK